MQDLVTQLLVQNKKIVFKMITNCYSWEKNTVDIAVKVYFYKNL